MNTENLLDDNADIVYNNGEIKIIKGRIGSKAYDDTLKLRSSERDMSAQPDGVDQYSTTYCLYFNNIPAAAMRVTRPLEGILDNEQYFPRPIIEAFRHLLGASSRLVRSDEWRSAPWITKLLMQETWRDNIRLGIRIDLSTCRHSILAYYERLGYRVICNTYFRNPFRNTDNHVMLMTAEQQKSSFFHDVFKNCNNIITHTEIENVMPLCDGMRCADCPSTLAKRIKRRTKS